MAEVSLQPRWTGCDVCRGRGYTQTIYDIGPGPSLTCWKCLGECRVPVVTPLSVRGQEKP